MSAKSQTIVSPGNALVLKMQENCTAKGERKIFCKECNQGRTEIRLTENVKNTSKTHLTGLDDRVTSEADPESQNAEDYRFRNEADADAEEHFVLVGARITVVVIDQVDGTNDRRQDGKHRHECIDELILQKWNIVLTNVQEKK